MKTPELCATPAGALAALIERQADGPQRVRIRIIEGYRFYEVSDHPEGEST